MFNLSDTIASICTPKGTGAIAAVRISGSDSWKIIEQIFFRRNKVGTNEPRTTKPSGFTHMKACYGHIKDKNQVIDEVVVLPYKAPNSFTAEDVIEIFCHGGIRVSEMVLNLCLKYGTRLAHPGEFTFRAFTNGRIDLTAAEAIHDVINASTDKEIYLASQILSGSLKNKISSFRGGLYSLVTSLEGSIEFPLDVGEVDRKRFASSLEVIISDLDELIEDSNQGRVLREGIKLSIIGAPNVGKSSLLNQLLEDERAIVTSTPGTTRDTIEERLILKGWPIVLVDTAGIREHHMLDEAEEHGMQRTKRAVEKSDLILFVKDLSKHNDNDSLKLYELTKNKPGIVVGNKVDLIQQNGKSVGCDIKISATQGTKIDDLKSLIVAKIEETIKPKQSDASIFVNERQKELLTQTRASIQFVIEQCTKDIPDDLIADELKKAISKLDEVTGQSVNDDVVKNIFSKFCIGK